MSTTARTSRRSSAIRIRLSAPLRRTILLIHIVTAVSWIGIDVVMGVLIFTAMATGDRYLQMICYGALDVAIFWPLITVGVLSLLSGLLLGWSTNYGVLRYTWVWLKLVLNLLLSTLVIIALAPSLGLAGEVARVLSEGGNPDRGGLRDLLYPPLVSTSALFFASFLAVFKPWGRTRRSAARRPRPDSDVRGGGRAS